MIFTVTAPGAIAVLGFLFTYLYTGRQQRISDRLARVNRRLGDLYETLLTLSDTNRISYSTFPPTSPATTF